MKPAVDTLPEPPDDDTQRSQLLLTAIEQVCQQREAGISFAEYMQMALYQPGLGYYSNGSQKFGAEGDFITAPEVSALYSQCLARQVASVGRELGEYAVLEFGAGSGRMAADILQALAQQKALPEAYYILEVSAELRQRQRATITTQLPDLVSRVSWLDELPKGFKGVVLANEVLDAMPVECFRRHADNIEQMYVRVADSALESVYQPASTAVAEAVATIEERREATLPNSYCSELNLHHRPWLEALYQSLECGVVLLIDYGYGVKEYYHEQRNRGTLMCHYRQRAHADPFWYPGLQDITSYVDFTEIADAAIDAGFEMLGYTTQAAFLMGAGLAELHQEQVSDDVRVQVVLSQQIKTLTLPSEMGERFKVMGLGKGFAEPLRGFAMADFRNRL